MGKNHGDKTVLELSFHNTHDNTYYNTIDLVKYFF